MKETNKKNQNSLTFNAFLTIRNKTGLPDGGRAGGGFLAGEDRTGTAEKQRSPNSKWILAMDMDSTKKGREHQSQRRTHQLASVTTRRHCPFVVLNNGQGLCPGFKQERWATAKPNVLMSTICNRYRQPAQNAKIPQTAPIPPSTGTRSINCPGNQHWKGIKAIKNTWITCD